MVDVLRKHVENVTVADCCCGAIKNLLNRNGEYLSLWAVDGIVTTLRLSVTAAECEAAAVSCGIAEVLPDVLRKHATTAAVTESACAVVRCIGYQSGGNHIHCFCCCMMVVKLIPWLTVDRAC
jgi:hypothetical protein